MDSNRGLDSLRQSSVNSSQNCIASSSKAKSRPKSVVSSFSQSAFKHIPSEQVSDLGNLIDDALTDVPKLPAKFDRRNETVMGINDDKKKGKFAPAEVPRGDFSKFMLERLKKYSILNHEVFKHDGIDYKK